MVPLDSDFACPINRNPLMNQNASRTYMIGFHEVVLVIFYNYNK